MLEALGNEFSVVWSNFEVQRIEFYRQNKEWRWDTVRCYRHVTNILTLVRYFDGNI
jgi:hypothetical protein